MLDIAPLLLSSLLAPQNQPTVDHAARWRQDIDFATAELAKRHKNLFAKMSKEEWAASAKLAKESLGANPDAARLGAAMLRHVARIGDGHTSFSWQQIGLPQLPLKLAEFKEGLFVTGDGTESRALKGARLTHIEGRSIGAWWPALAPLVSHENEHLLRLRGAQFLIVPALLHAAGLAKSPKHLDIRAVTPDGKEIRERVVSLSPSALGKVRYRYAFTKAPLCLTQQRLLSWFRYLPDSKAVYLKFNRCTDAKGFAKTVEEMWAAVEEKPVERLILDVRHNGGGSEYVMTPLVRSLLKRRKLLRTGLFVIIGRRTFSSAMNNAITLRKQFKAVLIGASTAGKPNHFGEVKALKLPQSRLTIRYSSNYFRKVKGDPPALVPDIEVAIPAADFFAGRDPFLETACKAPLRVLKKK